MMIQLADAQPYRFSHIVNLDGIPYQSRIPDVAEPAPKMIASEIAGWWSTGVARRTPSAGGHDRQARRTAAG